MPQRKLQYKRKQKRMRRRMFGMENSVQDFGGGRRAVTMPRAPAYTHSRSIPVVSPPSYRVATRNASTQTQRKKRVVSRANASTQTGGYLQWEEARAKMNIGKNMTMLNQLARKMKLAETRTLYKFQGIKNFDDNGFYWLRNITTGLGGRWMPFYAFDLTSCVNVKDAQNIVNSTPASVAYIDDATGHVKFSTESGVKEDGITSSPYWSMEQSTGSGTNPVFSGVNPVDLPNLPHSKDLLKWVSVNFNLWGAKAKSTKYVAQLVQFKNDELIPLASLAVSNKRTSFYQSLLKQYMYNPISTTGLGEFKKYIKVLKSETFNIGPTSTTESDADPHVKTVKWYIKMNKVLNYDTTANTILTSSDFADQPDYSINIGNQNDAYIDPQKRIYFILYSTNYGADVGNTNAETPSFDISIRKAHIHLD